MGETIASIITGKEWQFEKRFADFKNKKTRTGGFDSSELYAQLLQKGEYEQIRNLPTEMQWTTKWSKEANKEVDIASGAIWFTECPSIIYGDTDSCYFATGATNYEDAVSQADDIAIKTNASFPKFMQEAFNCTDGRQNLIKAAREVVAERALFMFAKKKYTLKVVNLDGKDLRSKPKLKSMGSEIKKADTPKVVQEFLKGLMNLLLAGEKYSVLEEFVNSYRGTLIGPDTNILDLAPAKQVNNLDTYYAEFKRTEKVGNGKCKLPGHVRAAINFNELIELYDPEGIAKPLKAGDKAAILYLQPNHLNLKSIGFPAELNHLPEWFKENFEVDLDLTEKNMIDAKIESIFEVIGEELPTPQNSFLNSCFTF